MGAYEGAEDVEAKDAFRVLVDARLLGVCLGSSMFPVVCMFLAGLYVAFGSCGRAALKLVSRGNLPGSGGPGLAFGMPRGP